MTINFTRYDGNGKVESFETRPGFELKLEVAETTAEAVWYGEAKNGYFSEDGICNWIYGTTHFEVS